jgi:prophage regulatory protein
MEARTHTEATKAARLINKRQVLAMIPVCEKTLYNMEKRGDFPRRFSITARLVAWDAGEVEAWMLAQQSAGRQIQAPNIGQQLGKHPSPVLHPPLGR